MIEQDKKPVIKAVAYEVRHEPEDEYDFGYSETRYRLVNMDTDEIVDDAQGYGYKTAAGAHRAYGYKSMPKSRKRKSLPSRNVRAASARTIRVSWTTWSTVC